jgi:hypothetical protein
MNNTMRLQPVWQRVAVHIHSHVLRYLLIILAVSVLLRVGAALVMGNAVETLPGIDDQLSYHTLAQQVMQGRGFTMPTNWWPLTRAGEPTAHWSYLYTLYLIGVYSVFGVHPFVARLIQVVLVGLLWPWLAWRLGRRLGGDAVGLVAAGWTAVYGYFAYYAAALMTEPFYITAILCTLDIALNTSAAHPTRRWLLLGLASGVAVLLRQSFMLFLPVLVLWAWWMQAQRDSNKTEVAKRSLGALLQHLLRVIRYPLLAAAVVVLMILPWTARNTVAFGRVVLLNTNAGYAFFFANHPIYGTQFVGILPNNVTYQSLVPPELRMLDEAALDSALMKQGLSYVTQDPVRYVLLSLSRIKTFFTFWPSSDSGTLSNVVRVLSFGVALPFMLLGLLLALRRWREWSLPYLFVIVYTAIHLLSWALIRYRLPVDAVLLIFAAYAVVELAQRLRARALTRATNS